MKFKIALSVALAALLWITTSMCSSGTDSSNAAETSAKSTSKNTGIKWYSYDEGMAIGEKEGKKIMIHFFTGWCTYCKKMDRETFSKSEVASYMNENFISIRLNSEIEKQLSREYRVSGWPTTWFLDKDGKKTNVLPGYLNRKMFLAYLKYTQSDSYRDMTFNTFKKKK